MTRLKLEVPEALRAQLRQRCADAPASPDISTGELVDLTFHAVSEAIATIDTISARAPNQMAQVMVMSLTIATMVEQILQSLSTSRGAQS